MIHINADSFTFNNDEVVCLCYVKPAIKIPSNLSGEFGSSCNHLFVNICLLPLHTARCQVPADGVSHDAAFLPLANEAYPHWISKFYVVLWDHYDNGSVWRWQLCSKIWFICHRRVITDQFILLARCGDIFALSSVASWSPGPTTVTVVGPRGTTWLGRPFNWSIYGFLIARCAIRLACDTLCSTVFRIGIGKASCSHWNWSTALEMSKVAMTCGNPSTPSLLVIEWKAHLGLSRSTCSSLVHIWILTPWTGKAEVRPL